MFGKEWRWRRGDGYGFVRLVLDAHHDWKNIDGGEDKVGIGRQTEFVNGHQQGPQTVNGRRQGPQTVNMIHGRSTDADRVHRRPT